MTQQWFERQLLPPRHGISIADVVDKAGWIPSAGGTGPYLSIRARIPRINRQDVDDAIFERIEILQLPSVRDTAFLVPRADAGIALAAGRRSYAERLRKLSSAESGSSTESGSSGSASANHHASSTPRSTMETFIREQLGDHKYYAFDSGGTRAKRVEFVDKWPPETNS